jgi:hypothetical protein
MYICKVVAEHHAAGIMRTCLHPAGSVGRLRLPGMRMRRHPLPPQLFQRLQRSLHTRTCAGQLQWWCCCRCCSVSRAAPVKLCSPAVVMGHM